MSISMIHGARAYTVHDEHHLHEHDNLSRMALGTHIGIDTSP